MIRRYTFFLLVLIVAFSVAGKYPSVRHPSPDGKKTTLAIVPDQLGNYSVAFVAGFPVPEGTTMTAYTVDASGMDIPLGISMTITSENAGRGWMAWIFGGWAVDSSLIPVGAPLPPGTTAFKVAFTGTESFNVSAKVNDLPAAIRVDSNTGKVFIEDWDLYSTTASLNGKMCPIENGWVTPPPGFTGPDVVVAVCRGFPNLECRTKITDIPDITRENANRQRIESQ